MSEMTENRIKMKTINNNLILFEYDLFNFNCLLIKTKKRLFVVDTYMGPDSMSEVKAVFDELSQGRDCFVINTHSHFDHIWGNCLFENTPLISHVLCRERIIDKAQTELDSYRVSNPEWVKGDVKIVYPDMTFSDKLIFEDEDCTVVLEHFPGHSPDSIIIWLEPYHICLAGDSLEDPFPLAHEYYDLSGAAVLLKSLRNLHSRKPKAIYPAHGRRYDGELLIDNISYIANLLESLGNESEENALLENINNNICEISQRYLQYHARNVSALKEHIHETI